MLNINIMDSGDLEEDYWIYQISLIIS